MWFSEVWGRIPPWPLMPPPKNPSQNPTKSLTGDFTVHKNCCLKYNYSFKFDFIPGCHRRSAWTVISRRHWIGRYSLWRETMQWVWTCTATRGTKGIVISYRGGRATISANEMSHKSDPPPWPYPENYDPPLSWSRRIRTLPQFPSRDRTQCNKSTHTVFFLWKSCPHIYSLWQYLIESITG